MPVSLSLWINASLGIEPKAFRKSITMEDFRRVVSCLLYDVSKSENVVGGLVLR
jgi:hypothetical protein